jgi:hypothetical protein
MEYERILKRGVERKGKTQKGPLALPFREYLPGTHDEREIKRETRGVNRLKVLRD